MKKTKKKDYIKNYAHGIPLGEYSELCAYFNFFHINVIPCAFRYLSTVIIDFFYIQFMVKFHLRKIPVVKIDHPLDELIPFKPRFSTVYLDFINLWIRALAMATKVFGMEKGLPLLRKFLDYQTLAYKSALRIYRCYMTTTFRPPFNKKKYPLLASIRGFDPHLLCVPSLHVALMTLLYVFFRDAFSHESRFTVQSKRDALLTEIRGGVIEIIESVLYIKQHSVNCIPAALFMMCNIVGEIFTKDDALNFIEALFKDRTDIAEKDKVKIHEHLHYVFERMFLENCYENDWAVTVRRYIKRYST